MKYLVESYKKRQTETPVDPADAFFRSIAATVKSFSPYHQNIYKVKNICDCISNGNDINFKRNQVYAFIRVFLWLSR
jgi:hypothetical protein